MDCFLMHPEVWSLEINRRTHESGGTAIAVPEMTRLDWTLSQVAMQLVLKGDAERRAQLVRVSQQLEAHGVGANGTTDAVVRRWASELDISNYRAEPHDEGIAISVDYDPAVLAELAARVAPAERGLAGGALIMRAISIRDGGGEPERAESVWEAVRDYVADASDADMYVPGDMIAAAAAAVVVASKNGVDVSDETVRDCVGSLLEAALAVSHNAPPSVAHLPEAEAPPTDADGEYREVESSPRVLRSTVWDMGFDRSAASGLALLISDSSLCERAGVPTADVRTALVNAATSPYYEARRRLVGGLIPLTGADSCHEEDVHDAVLGVCLRLVATAGYGPPRPWGAGYPFVTLPEPASPYLLAATDLVLDVAAAAFAIPLLSALEVSGCKHAAQASESLSALFAYDERLWPTKYARKHYSDVDYWRRELDRALARRVLEGDVEALNRRLAAYAGYDEQQAGLLQTLPEEATTPARVQQLHRVWHLLHDRLLPAVRQLGSNDSRRDRVNWRDVEELDEALLLTPGDHATDWPWAETLAIATRWFAAYEATPTVADRAIKFVARLLGLDRPLAVQLALSVIGDDFKMIKRESRLTVHFTQIVLRTPPPEPLAAQVRTLLDGLAALGDEAALAVQYEQENG